MSGSATQAERLDVTLHERANALADARALREGERVRFSVLGSGSKGNAVVVDGGGARVLIDVGFGPRELRARLRTLELDLQDIDAILLTHGHGDHVKGARQVAGALNVPTYTTDETRRFCSTFTSLKNHVPITPDTPFVVGGMTILPVATPHDAPGSVCFVLHDGDDKVGVCTDLGAPEPHVGAALHGCDALVLEHNHDAEMLRLGPYSAHLKRRIASRFGHLSNVDGAKLLAMATSSSLTRVLLAHLSEVNNTPALALAAARPVLDGRDVELTCAPQHHPTGWLRAKRAGPSGTASVAIAPTSVSTSARTPPPATSNAPPSTNPTPASSVDAQLTAAPTRHIAMERQMALFAPASVDARKAR